MQMTQSKPTKGRIVTFVFAADEELPTCERDCPAIITRVWSDSTVSLQLFPDASQLPHLSPHAIHQSSVVFDPIGADGRTWHWPERAPVLVTIDDPQSDADETDTLADRLADTALDFRTAITHDNQNDPPAESPAVELQGSNATAGDVNLAPVAQVGSEVAAVEVK